MSDDDFVPLQRPRERMRHDSDDDLPAPAFPPPPEVTDEIDMLNTAPLRAVSRRPSGSVRWKRWILMLIVASVCAGVDQASKQWAHTTLLKEHAGRHEVVDGFFSLTYVRNPGAAWGFLARRSAGFRRPFFLAVSVVAIAFILYLFVKLENGQHLLMFALSLVMGGALGNFIDRVQYNYVIDFLDVHVATFKWPTFNIADAAITAGVALLLGEMVVASIRQRRLRRARRSVQPIKPEEEP